MFEFKILINKGLNDTADALGYLQFEAQQDIEHTKKILEDVENWNDDLKNRFLQDFLNSEENQALEQLEHLPEVDINRRKDLMWQASKKLQAEIPSLPRRQTGLG